MKLIKGCLILQTACLFLLISVDKAMQDYQITTQKQVSFCDIQITQQLQQQNIDYECNNNKIVMQNKPQIEFGLNLIDFQITSQLVIENVNQVKLNNLYLCNLKMDKEFFDAFISMRNINNLQIQNFTAEFNKKNEALLNLMSISQIQKTEIGQFLVYSEQEGLNNHYQFIINSENLFLRQVLFQNIYALSLNFYGTNLLDIDQLNIIQNSQYEKQSVFLGYSFCYYSSQNNINISTINIETNSVNQKESEYQLWFASIKIENNEFQQSSQINIDQITFKSQDVNFQSFGIVQFETEKIYYHLQLEIQKIQNVEIGSLVFEGFGNQRQNSYNNNIFFKLQNILNMNIMDIIFRKNNQVMGTLFDGAVYQLKIFNLEVQPFNNFTTCLINLQNSYYVSIGSLKIQDEVEFNNYLFAFNNLKILIFNNFDINKIYFKQQSLLYIYQVQGFTVSDFQLKDIKTSNQQNDIFYINTANLQHPIKFLNIKQNRRGNVISSILISKKLILTRELICNYLLNLVLIIE
ncbi:hypothetical protein ABPG74_012824 [Tetrahymena malaccensis]